MAKQLVAKNRYNVPAAKVRRMAEMVDATLSGDRVAEARFVESISTSDAPLALAQVFNVNILGQYAAIPSISDGFAQSRVVRDFTKVRFIDIVGDFTQLSHAGTQAAYTLPVIPELSVYPYVQITSKETDIATTKQGAKFGYSWEEGKADPIGFLADFPNQMAVLARNTEDAIATNALITGVTSYSNLQAQASPIDGSAIVATSRLSIHSLSAALQQVSLRQVNGRFVQVSNFALVVPPGLEFLANAIINFTNFSLTDGSVRFDAPNFNPVANVSVVVDPWLTSATAWYLVPKPGAAPRLAVVKTKVVGEEEPEIRVNGLQGGYYPGGGDADWSAGSFDNDAIDFRLRTTNGAGIVTEEGIVWSNGTTA